MNADWEERLRTFLHDPPDKALSIEGHESRARDNANIAVDNDISRRIMKETASLADLFASIIERFPMPTAGENGERAVEPENGQLQIAHPLSAEKKELVVPELDGEKVKKQIQIIIDNLPGKEEELIHNRFLTLWRLLPGTLAKNVHPCFALLPADTRTPDHTIWNHLDITAGLKAAEIDKENAALLAFTLGPVQKFIEASQSVRDLWSGSMILSWLAFQSMLPIIKQLGPTALVYPSLRGIPLLDIWLRDNNRLYGKFALPDLDLRRAPCIPNRFLAIVPWGDNGSEAKDLVRHCQTATKDAWGKMAEAVKDDLEKKLGPDYSGWDKRWDEQIENYFSSASAVIPLRLGADEEETDSLKELDQQLAQLLTDKDSFEGAFPNAESVRELARSIPVDQTKYPQDHAGRWQYQVELVQRSLAAHRTIRHVPTNKINGNVNQQFPQKCTLFGSFEQMGPDKWKDSKSFWDSVSDSKNGLNIHGIRIRKGEGLCAVALVKRFAPAIFLAKKLEINKRENPRAFRFPDTWTVAAEEWLDGAEIHWWLDKYNHPDPWNGSWLHWSKPDQVLDDAPKCPEHIWEGIQTAKKKNGSPPAYYAILKLDGDTLGEWLRGENSPKVRDVMHPKLVDYYEALDERTKKGLEAQRPVSPSLHAAISTALANFALHVVPKVEKDNHGTVIYSGGDDTLILLPTSQALKCAKELQEKYSSNFLDIDGREQVMMGEKATLSGGLVIVHAKDDLRLALQDARSAEKKAKESGRNVLAITIRRRSGEHTMALCPWEFVPKVDKWKTAFQEGASDRWAYHLYSEKETLGQLPIDAIKAEMKRQIKRAEKPTPEKIPPEELIKTFDDFQSSKVIPDDHARFSSPGIAFKHFLTLCQSASFMARGRD